MSFALSAALQTAIYDRLTSDAALSVLLGGAIYDALPEGPVPPLYLALGPETVRDRSDATGHGAEHLLTLTVVSTASGFAGAKATAGAACDALDDAPLPLARGTLISLRFDRARARREAGGTRRRIDLTFRARVADD